MMLPRWKCALWHKLVIWAYRHSYQILHQDFNTTQRVILLKYQLQYFVSNCTDELEEASMRNSVFLAPLTWRSAQRSWWYYWFVHRPSVNFCFKSLLLLQFLFDHSEFFTGETRHIVPPCNKAGISNFYLEFQKFVEIPDFLKTLLLLQFLFDHSEIYTAETRHIVPPCNKTGISNCCLEFQKLQKYCRNARFLETLLLLEFLFDHSEICTGETRYIVSPYNKARISNFCLDFEKLQKF